jgi:hypothetical protein
MNSIQDFISTFRKGFQETNRFICQVYVQPEMVARIIADSATGDLGGSLLGQISSIVQTAASIENSVLSVPQVVKWLAQGYLCNDVRLPSREFGTTDLSMYGITEHFPVHTEYSAITCQFMMPYAYISNDSAVPRFFNYWQNQIQHAQRGPDSGFDFNFPSDYYGTMLITTFDRKNKGGLTYKFTNVYPKTVDSVPLSWALQDQYCMLPVSFNFSYFTVLPVADSLALSLLDSVI